MTDAEITAELAALSKTTLLCGVSNWVEHLDRNRRGRWVVIHQKNGATVGARFARLSHARGFAAQVAGVVRHFHRRVWKPPVTRQRSVISIAWKLAKPHDTAIATTVAV